MSDKMQAKIAIHQRVRHRRVGEDGVIVCMHTGKVLVVNPVGVHIVDQLKQNKNIDQVIESICATFDVDPDVASKDLTVYLDQLIKDDVILTSDAKNL